MHKLKKIVSINIFLIFLETIFIEASHRLLVFSKCIYTRNCNTITLFKLYTPPSLKQIKESGEATSKLHPILGYAPRKNYTFIHKKEPEQDGSTSGVQIKHRNIVNSLDIKDELEYINKVFQDYEGLPNYFDLIILVESINHLNEEACIKIPEEFAIKEFDIIFEKLKFILKDGGSIIITDCSPNNIYNDVGIKNPFDRSIEWHKHQTPDTWMKLLSKHGFKNFIISRQVFYSLGIFGDFLMNNKLISYFTHSMFRLQALLKK